MSEDLRAMSRSRCLGEIYFPGFATCHTYLPWGHISSIGFCFAGFDGAEDIGIMQLGFSGFCRLKVRFQASWRKIPSFRTFCFAN